ncbi:MAG: hypothetical protein NTZ59_01805 [Bacteroidetes bacterium]|jgi:dihydroorotase|nr:hypothetical protein [Bacteroidota bacterium]
MKNNEQLNLIAGSFSGEEAKEILMNVFSTKIQFHKVKNFVAQERNGTPDEKTNNRIAELQKEIEKIIQVTANAQQNNKRLLLQAVVNIELID